MHVLDANVLLYAVNPATAHHRPARDWLDDALESEEAVAFTWAVLLAFIRVSTNAAIFDRPLEPSVACAVVRGWLGRPSAVVVDPTTRHIDILAGLLAEAGTAGNIVADAHLAAIAIERDASVVSFDADFGRFAGLRWIRPS